MKTAPDACRTVGGQFPFSALPMSFHCLLATTVSMEKSSVSLIAAHLKIIGQFLVSILRFSSFINKTTEVLLPYTFILLEIWRAFWICGLIFVNFGKFSVICSSHLASALFSLAPLLGFHYSYVRSFFFLSLFVFSVLPQHASIWVFSSFIYQLTDFSLVQ